MNRNYQKYRLILFKYINSLKLSISSIGLFLEKKFFIFKQNKKKEPIIHSEGIKFSVF